MHFVDRDVVVLYTLYIIKPDLILHNCNSALPMDFLRCLCVRAKRTSTRALKIV